MCTVCYFQRDYFKKNVTVPGTVDGFFFCSFVLICFCLKDIVTTSAAFQKKLCEPLQECQLGPL